MGEMDVYGDCGVFVGIILFGVDVGVIKIWGVV